MAELQIGYIMQLVDRLRSGDSHEISASPEAMARFESQRTEAAKGTIWSTGCRSWYLDDRGIPPLALALLAIPGRDGETRLGRLRAAPMNDANPGRQTRLRTGSEPSHPRAASRTAPTSQRVASVISITSMTVLVVPPESK